MYFEVIWKVLREPMQKALEALLMQRQTRREVQLPPSIKKLFEEVILKDFHDGYLKGEVKGGMKMLREKIVQVAQRRGAVLTDEQVTRIQACDDRELLDRWFDNAFDATNGDEVFR